MIERVQYTNFKALKDVGFRPAPLTVLVGPNSSGKTSVLEGLHYLAQAGTRSTLDYMRGPRDPTVLATRHAAGPTRIEIEGRWDGARHGGAAALTMGGHESPAVSGQWEGDPFEFAKGQPVSSEDRLRTFGRALASAVLLRFNAERLGAPSYSADEVPRVEYDGYGLATVIADLQTADRGRFA